jgi:hypothetical protein
MKREEQAVSAPEKLSQQEAAAKTFEIMNSVGTAKSDREIIDDLRGQLARARHSLEELQNQNGRLQAMVNTLRGKANHLAIAMGM